MTLQVASKRVAWLLKDLCVQLGYCTAARDEERFAQLVPRGADAFADAVLVTEGLDPELEKGARRDVRALVAARFAQWTGEGAT